MSINRIKKLLHRHKWEYERHNSYIIRSCYCQAIEEGIIIEEPELISTASMRQKDINIVIWRRI